LLAEETRIGCHEGAKWGCPLGCSIFEFICNQFGFCAGRN
jgi:hypothetical protein